MIGEAETPSEAETVESLDLKPVNKKEVALVTLSRDFLALRHRFNWKKQCKIQRLYSCWSKNRAACDKAEDENARLKGEINQLILKEREKQIFLDKGLENTKPMEMAHEYSKSNLPLQ